MARTLVWATKSSWERLLSSQLLSDSGFDNGPLLLAAQQIKQANAILNTPNPPLSSDQCRPAVALCAHPGCPEISQVNDLCPHHARSLQPKLSLSSLSLPSKLPGAPTSYQPMDASAAIAIAPPQVPVAFDSHPQTNANAPRRAQRSRNVYKCQAPNCTKFAQQSSDGKKTYCVSHMREKGLAPSSRCIHEGCEKYAMPSIDGSRVFCVSHQKARGMQPNLKRRMCQHPNCSKQARKSLNGGTTFCKSHMKFHGLLPNVPGCSHVGCAKQAQLSINGKTVFCKAHMKEHGLLPRQRSCGVPGCRKRAKQSWNGPATYCIAHMKGYGLVPKLRLCQHDSCTKQAVPDTSGRRDFCVNHMREHGLQPYFRAGLKKGKGEEASDEDEDDDEDY